MELSIMVAKIIALIYLPLGIAMFAGQLKAKELVTSFGESSAASLVMGYLGVIAGISLITHHNIWVMDWPVLITAIGWITVIDSVLLLALPKTMSTMTKWISKNDKLWGFISIILGLIFGYFGFIA